MSAGLLSPVVITVILSVCLFAQEKPSSAGRILPRGRPRSIRFSHGLRYSASALGNSRVLRVEAEAAVGVFCLRVTVPVLSTERHSQDSESRRADGPRTAPCCGQACRASVAVIHLRGSALTPSSASCSQAARLCRTFSWKADSAEWH
jgi:hypothetical protein